VRLLFDQNLSPRLVGSTGEIAALLRQRHADLLAFEQDETASFLALG
jgi:hypothetical protein